MLTSNANPSTCDNRGDDSWAALHQTGNMREHNNYWCLTEIFQAADRREPAALLGPGGVREPGSTEGLIAPGKLGLRS
jgi:hypothetical protein